MIFHRGKGVGPRKKLGIVAMKMYAGGRFVLLARRVRVGWAGDPPTTRPARNAQRSTSWWR